MAKSGFSQLDNDFFSARLEDGILSLEWKNSLIDLAYDIEALFDFYDSLDKVIGHGGFKVLLAFGDSKSKGFLETAKFIACTLSFGRNNKLLDRLFNLINRYVISLATINCVTVHAASGWISQFNLNLSLAYDYRVIGEDTVFENHNANLGLISKGGGGYFMSRLLGVRKACEVLQWSSFGVEEALQLGLVDKIAPAGRLKETALEVARRHIQKPTATLLGLRKLLKCDIMELTRNLDLENQLILTRLASPDFEPAFSEYCKLNLNKEELAELEACKACKR